MSLAAPPGLFYRASSVLFLLAVTLSLVLGVFRPALACASLFRLAALGGVRILVGPLVLGLNLIGTWDPPCCAAPVRAAPLCHSPDSQQGSHEECQAEVLQSLHRLLLKSISPRHIARPRLPPLSSRMTCAA